MSESCRTCRFWKSTTVSNDNGECRRRMPLLGWLGAARWPDVEAIEWCGEYERKTETSVNERGDS